jgi:PAS domain S-box-containing protein
LDTASYAPSAELLRLIVESSNDFAIFTTDQARLVTSWNSGAERLFGFTPDEMMGSSSDAIFTPEDREAGAPEREQHLAEHNGRAADERWHQRKDGTVFWASGLMMLLSDGSGFVKITRDRSEQHAAEEQTRQSEERFRLLATSIPQLVFRTRGNGDRTWPSPQWIDFTGQTFDDSLALGWLEAIHPDDREPTLAAWRDAEQLGEYYCEHRVWRTPDGEYRWHQTRARPVDWPGASDDWVGTMTDIHDLRALKDRQQVLMAELQHRTRNLLAVVQAVASQTLRNSDSLETFRPEFEKRLRALSRVQGLFSRADQQDIELRVLVESELAAHADQILQPDKIKVEGPPVALPATSAQALGLGVHELATNAVKYGALAHPQGQLSLTWALGEDQERPEVILEWRETGVPMPTTKPTRKGYGRELIERALPYQLSAKTELTFTPEGVHCVLAVPVRASIGVGKS